MGASATIALGETGLAPAGGGCILSSTTPCAGFAPLRVARARRVARPAHPCADPHSIGRDRPPHARRRVGKAARLAAAAKPRAPGPGRGVCCHVEATFEHLTELTCSVGVQGATAERGGERAAKTMPDFIGSSAAVGRHPAGQLLLPPARAGAGSLTTMAPTSICPPPWPSSSNSCRCPSASPGPPAPPASLPWGAAGSGSQPQPNSRESPAPQPNSREPPAPHPSSREPPAPHPPTSGNPITARVTPPPVSPRPTRWTVISLFR